MKKGLVFLVAFLCMFVFAVAGCSPDETPQNTQSTYYTVTFDSRGGSSVESQRVLDGNPVRRPETPRYDGYNFVGWFTDENAADTLWDFDTDRVSSDMTLYAGWQELSQEPTASLVFELDGDAYIVTGVGEETAVVIPEEYNGLPVTAIRGEYGTGAFARKDIVSVVIPDSIVEIGQNTFSNCNMLQTVSISSESNLRTIGNNAFSGCSSLTSIYIPEGAVELGNNIFNNCGALESITVAEGNAAYRSENGHFIEAATDTLLRGGNNGMIPEGVRAIAQAAFRRSSVTEVVVPATVTEIGNYAFDDCVNLAEITVAEQNTEYASLDGILYNKELTELVKVPEGISGAISLPEALGEIPMYAFDGLDGISSLYIPYGALTNIRFGAFRNTSMTIRYGGTQAQWEAIQKHAQWGGAELEILFDSEEPAQTSNILVVYFSCTGNTEGIAQTIAEMTDGVLWEVQAAVLYTSADLNYNDYDCRANTEQRDPYARPAIAGVVENFESYDAVFVGYPIWQGQAPKIIYTFFDSYDFSDKDVYLFSTSASSGGSGAVSALQRTYSHIAVEDDIHFTSAQLDSAQIRLESWLETLKIIGTGERSVEGTIVEMLVRQHILKLELTDNSATRDLVARLSESEMTLEFSDYAGAEKIAYPAESLDVSDAKGCDPAEGDLTVYMPWGNLAAFYRDTSGYSDSLVLIGKILDDGIEILAAQSGHFNVTLRLAG